MTLKRLRENKRAAGTAVSVSRRHIVDGTDVPGQATNTISSDDRARGMARGDASGHLLVSTMSQSVTLSSVRLVRQAVVRYTLLNQCRP